MYIHIPVEIEIGSMVLVVLNKNVNKSYIDLIGRWCEVVKIKNNKIQVTLLNRKFYVGLYNIEEFTFGDVIIQNPDFNINKVIKK